MGTSIGIIQLFAATGAMPSYHDFLYLTGLLWGLLMAVNSFSRLLREATMHEDEP